MFWKQKESRADARTFQIVSIINASIEHGLKGACLQNIQFRENDYFARSINSDNMDKPDFNQWVEAYTEEMYQRARYKVNDSEIAKDIVQDTFMAAAEGIHNFREDSAPKTWLFSILNRKIIDHYRNRYKQPVKMESTVFSLFFNEEGEWNKSKMPSSWDEEETHLLDNEEFLAVLKKCFDLLPDKWSACMKLKYFMDKKGEEICQELAITPSNLWQMMHRAKLKLRDCVESNWVKN